MEKQAARLGPLPASADLPPCSAPHSLRPSSFSSRTAALGRKASPVRERNADQRPCARARSFLLDPRRATGLTACRTEFDEEDSQRRTVVGDGASLTAHYLASAAKSDQRTNPRKAAPSRVNCVTCPAWGGWGGTQVWGVALTVTLADWRLSPLTQGDRVKLVEQKVKRDRSAMWAAAPCELGNKRRPGQSRKNRAKLLQG